MGDRRRPTGAYRWNTRQELSTGLDERFQETHRRGHGRRHFSDCADVVDSSAQYSLYVVDCDDCVCGVVWVVDGFGAREAD